MGCTQQVFGVLVVDVVVFVVFVGFVGFVVVVVVVRQREVVGCERK